MSPPPLKPDSSSQANFQPLSASADSCSSPILEPERSALLQEALADSQLQAVKAQLERRGLSIKADEAQAVQLPGGQQVLIPFGEDAHLVWTRTNGQTVALGLIRQGNKTLNVSAEGRERVVSFLPQGKAQRLLSGLRQKSKFQDFERKLAQKGKRIGQVRVMVDETKGIAMVGIAQEGDEGKIMHQVRIKVKAGKEDEPEANAEPQIQATACGQASGEAVPAGAKLQALEAFDPGDGPGDGDLGGSYDGSEGRDYDTHICISQWGYSYDCRKLTPVVSLSTNGLALPQTFITQQTQASFTIWNGGGGRLTGTISASAPFSIVSGGSFSLLPGQPQQVTVRFSSATAGSFSQNLTITSNAGTKLMPVSGVAHKVTFSPATVSLGEGMFVVTEQCGGETGECMPYTRKVGLPLQSKLVVKNEGSVEVSLNLSTSAPFYLVSREVLTLAAGQGAEVAVRFDPADSGTFTGTLTATLQNGQGSLTSGPLTGVAHKITVSPTALNFFAFVEGPAITQRLTIANQGITTPFLAVTTSEPFSVDTSSFTLGTSESRDVKVQFSPTISGEFSSTISIKLGQVHTLSQMQAAFSIPVRGKSITKAEFFQWLSEISQRGPVDAVIPTDDVSVILRNFRNLTPADIQLLIHLAQTENWDSLFPVGIEPDDGILRFWLDQILGYLIGKIFDLLMPGGQPNIELRQSVISSLDNLVKALKRGETSFSGLYEGLKNDYAFSILLNTLKDIIIKTRASYFFASSGDVDDAVKEVIKQFCKVFGNYDEVELAQIYSHFGAAGVFAVAAVAKDRPGAINNVVNGFIAIAITQSHLQPQEDSKQWYKIHPDNTLWSNLVAALLTIGAAAANPGDLELQRRFNATIGALGVTATMAANGWAIFAFRAKAYIVDVVGGTEISGKRVVVFGQFFHAFIGFDRTQLEELLRAVAMLSIGSQGGINFLSSLFPGLINDAAYQAVRNANLFGVVIAVKEQNATEALRLIDQVIGEANSDRFFAIVIIVDDNKIITNIVIRGNIDQEIARNILSQMGIKIGNKMPNSPHVRFLIMMLMMHLGMIP